MKGKLKGNCILAHKKQHENTLTDKACKQNLS